MNHDRVKELLQSVYKAKEDFTVIFSSKKNKKVNGLYKPASKEIIIHNKNFQNDAALMYTAIHELAHHIMYTEKGQKGARSHTQNFWALFYDLMDIAEKKGIYKPEIDEETKKLIETAQSISKEIAALQRRLGEIIIEIESSCKKDGLCLEDIVERKAQISKQSAKVAVSAHYLGDHNIGVDLQSQAAKEKDEDKAAAIIAAGRKGKTVIQAKKINSATSPIDADDKTELLNREKNRLEKTIITLTRRLDEVEKQLEKARQTGVSHATKKN